MSTTSKKIVRDGLFVTNSISVAIVNTSSQNNLLQALANFHRILTPEEYAKLSTTPAPDQSSSGIAELARGICGEKSRRKFQSLSFRFEPFIRSIQRFSTVIDVMVSSKPEVAALVWGSVKLVIIVALDYFDYFERLSKVFERLGDLCPFFDRFQSILPESDKLRESLADFYAVSITICTEALKFLRKSGIGQLIESLWKPFNIGFQDLETELQRQQEIVDREINLASEEAAHRARQEASLYQNTGNKHRLETDLYQDEGRQCRQEVALYQSEGRRHRSAQMIHLRESRERALQQHMGEKKRRRKLLLSAISDYDHRSSFSDAYRKRHKDTGLWLFDTPEFKGWDQEQKSRGFWCHGIPGAGKTVLAAGAIDYLFLNHKSTQVLISYFFCDFAIKESTQARTILRSLIKQILSIFEQISPEMEKSLETMFLKNHREPETEELHRVLVSATQLPATTYLIIDGLDECRFDDRDQLLSCMNELTRNSKSRIKILISSREKVDISRSLKDFSQISLDSAKNRSDIEIFIRETIDQKLKKKVFVVSDPSMAEEIKQALIRGSDGMFLWVTFQILEICAENTDSDIRRVLRSLPKGLDETYSRILKRITANHKPDVAKKAFTWLAIVKRPLSLAELNEAVAFESGCLRWDQGNFQNSALNMLRNCGNLVNHDKLDGTVRFAHYTVLEFLVSQWVVADFFIRKQEANLYVGKICLTYLNFPDFETQLSKILKDQPLPAVAEWVNSMGQHNPHIELLSKVNPKRFLVGRGTSTINARTLQKTENINTNSQPSKVLSKKFHLLDYVAKNWIYHCSNLSQNDRMDWVLFENLLFRKMLPFDHLPWPHPDSRTSEFYLKTFWWAVEVNNSALLGAIYNALEAESMHTSTYTENRNGIGQTTLQAAAGSGHLDVVNRLIEANANVNAAPAFDSGRTALQAAAEGGHLEVVNRLIEANANVNATPGSDSGRTALQAAAGGGHLDVVNRLIEANANVNATPAVNIGRTALQAAAGGGHLDVVDRLIEANADVNAMPASNRGRTALQAAAEGGHMEVVNRLIEANANVNATPGSDSGRTALQAAAGGGHLDVVNRLIEANADVNATPAVNIGRTALQAAAGGGHLDVVNRLIEANADVNAMPASNRGRTALQAAAEGGHLEVVNRLIEANANVNATPASDRGRTALQAAAGGGYLDVVDRLIEAHANVNETPTSYRGRTALQAAAKGGHLEVVNRLIEVNADVNARLASDRGRTALQAAAEGGHLEVVNRLIEANANVNATPAVNSGRTALQAAAGGGHLDVVNRLIEANANVNARPASYRGRMALQAAAEGGHLEVVNRLIEANANVNATPEFDSGQTALQAASEGGHLEVVNRLIEANANVNATPEFDSGRTALQAAAEGGHLEVVNRLIEANANVNATPVSDSGRTALQAAAGGGHLDVVNRLIEANADVNAGPMSNNSHTALQAAVSGGYLDVVERLSNAGARK